MSTGVQFRFTANDADPQSINEAGLDAFSITQILCGGPVVCTKGDVNNDSVIDALDVGPFTATMIGGTPGTVEFCATDMDGDGVLEAGDDVGLFVTCLLTGICP